MFQRALLLTCFSLAMAGAPAVAASSTTTRAVSETAPASASGAEATDGVATKLIKRFIKVDDRLYRGGQPDEAGLKALQALGIKTIVSFRTGESAAEEARLAKTLGMTFVQIPISQRPFGVTLPAEAVAKFFSIIDNPESGKVFIHCRRGADRTGTFAGLYRIARQGWTSEKAYDEARAIGMRWWYFPMKGKMKALTGSLPAGSQPGGSATNSSAPATR